MDRYSRRKVLGLSAGSLVGIAECTGSDDTNFSSSSGSNGAGDLETERPDADGDGIPDNQDDYPRNQYVSHKQTKSDSRKLEEDEWRYYELSFNSTGFVKYDFVVRDGPEIDVIFIEESE